MVFRKHLKLIKKKGVDIVMEIYTVGYNHTHDKSFEIDRPNGLGSWMFLLIKTPAVFKEDGNEVTIKANSFVVYTTKTPHYYRTYGDEYIDDWFHFRVETEDEELFTALKLPLNTVTWLGNISELSFIIRQITYEFYSLNLYKDDIVESYLKILFLKLGSQIRMQAITGSGDIPVKYERIFHMRANIYNIPQLNPSIDTMAEELEMSRSGFQHTYKKIFGISIIQDIIESRLKHAKYLLLTTNYPLNIIAEQSGYNSELHLMRQFKQKLGLTPTEFRKKI